VFGPYRLVELLGRGGMGEVYRAYDNEHSRIVALKRLVGHLADEPEFEKRFRREAFNVARLRSPHIIPIHRYGEIDGQLYIDMRYVDGGDLADLVAAGPLAPSRAVRIVEQLAGALDEAHAHGLVHRDVKPSNVLLDTTAGDFCYLADFGITRPQSTRRSNSLTRTGAILGSLAYMAPEQFDGAVTKQSDIYSLTCLFYELLTGRKPYEGDRLPVLMHAHMKVPPPLASTHNPAAGLFDEVIATGMAKEATARYESAGALARAARAALERHRDNETAVRPEPRGTATSPAPAPDDRDLAAFDLDPGFIGHSTATDPTDRDIPLDRDAPADDEPTERDVPFGRATASADDDPSERDFPTDRAIASADDEATDQDTGDGDRSAAPAAPPLDRPDRTGDGTDRSVAGADAPIDRPALADAAAAPQPDPRPLAEPEGPAPPLRTGRSLVIPATVAAVTAAVLAVVWGVASGPNVVTGTPAAAPSPPQASAAPAPPPATVAPAVTEAVFAGRTSGNEMTLAVGVKGNRAAGYLCDGKKVEAWLEGEIKGNTLTLHGRDASTSVAATVDPNALHGNVTMGGSTLPFSAQAATGQAGLYQSKRVLNGIATRIGWIVLPDGSQVGIRNNGGTRTPAPALDPGTAQARDDNGDVVHAERISGSTTVLGP
jgi:serine/threonine protein kinase